MNLIYMKLHNENELNLCAGIKRLYLELTETFIVTITKLKLVL